MTSRCIAILVRVARSAAGAAGAQHLLGNASSHALVKYVVDTDELRAHPGTSIAIFRSLNYHVAVGARCISAFDDASIVNNSALQPPNASEIHALR